MTPLDRLFSQLLDAPSAFGPLPFWFWNDDLEDGELVRQLSVLRDAGCGGVVIHPRVGLAPRIGYLTEEYFRLVRLAVEECARLGLRVILYDEGSYPSGSACGQVVAANPTFAARALTLVQREVEGPWRGYWRPSPGRSLVNRLVGVVLAQTRDGAVDAPTLRVLPVQPGGMVRLDLEPGAWRVMACFDVPSGGHIRGVLPEQDDGSALAPPAGDLLNPEAVATFIRLTHDAYARTLGEHLGTTVVAMFTDEPSPLGRGAMRGAWPYTPGFEQYLATQVTWAQPSVMAWLPALWVDYGPPTQAFRRDYTRAVDRRLVEVFYGAQASWCERHGIALTGHPAESNDMESLAPFHWPGQDVVWRWVLPPGVDHPGQDTALSGAHSVSAKAAASAAQAAGRRRNATELFGAYGWHLSLDEAKWLLDWHLARGTNLFLPHAFFYSVREGRAFESEPDVGFHNVWWPYFQELLRYTRRMSWLLTDCELVCDVAVVGPGHALPWQAARALYRHQIDFLYVDDHTLAHADVQGSRLRAGAQAYRLLIVDTTNPDRRPPRRLDAAPATRHPSEPLDHVDDLADLSSASRRVLDAFVARGGTLLRFRADDAENELIATARRCLQRAGSSAVEVTPPTPDLRVLHLRKAGVEVYALFNEGEAPVGGILSAGDAVWEAAGEQRFAGAEWWDPLRGTRTPARRAAQGVSFDLHRRECRLLVLHPPSPSVAASVGPLPVVTGAVAGVVAKEGVQEIVPEGVQEGAWADIMAVGGRWHVHDATERPMAVPAPGDWTQVASLERFSGTLVYRTMVRLTAAPPGETVEVDLGSVGEAAVIMVNGRRAGSALWAPYRVSTASELWRQGENALEVRVTNSAANSYDGAMRPSGLLGPVRLLVAR